MSKVKHRKIFSILLSCLFMAQMLLPIMPFNVVSAAQPAPKSQQIKKVVETEPGGWDGIVYWYQEDDGMFKADFPDGAHPRVANGGTASQPFPGLNCHRTGRGSAPAQLSPSERGRCSAPSASR
jgi:hypothetical protein